MYVKIYNELTLPLRWGGDTVQRTQEESIAQRTRHRAASTALSRHRTLSTQSRARDSSSAATNSRCRISWERGRRHRPTDARGKYSTKDATSRRVPYRNYRMRTVNGLCCCKRLEQRGYEFALSYFLGKRAWGRKARFDSGDMPPPKKISST